MKARAEIRQMTKELVDHLLSMNTRNRPIKSSIVDAYVRDMAAGKWLLTGQGISVSDDLVLLDGQHRLEALKAAGYPDVCMVVVWGLDPVAQQVVDQHTKRSLRDVFQVVYNYAVSRITPAVCNVLRRARSGWTGGGSTVAEAYEVFAENKREIEWAAGLNDLGFWPAPCLAAAVTALKENPSRMDDITAFMNRVRNGENLNRQMPEWHLRSYLESSRKSGAGGAVQHERYGKTLKALRFALEGKPLGTLKV